MGRSTAMTIRVLGFPITIGVAFPLFMVILGYISRLEGIQLVIWVVFGTFAILVHELGHALAFRRYGLESSIQFWGLGGLTIPNDQEAAATLPDREWLVVSVAGPAIGLVLGAIGLALQGVVADQSPEIRSAVGTWTFVNLVWGIFNLLPIGRLDGGNAVMHLLRLAFGDEGEVLALVTSIAFSAMVVVVALANHYVYVAFIAVLFGLANPYQYRALFQGLFPGMAGRLEKRAPEVKQPRPRRYTFEDEPGPAWVDEGEEPPPQP